MTLSSLPPIILDLILSQDSTPYALRLWKCGDATLNLHLSNGGVTELSLFGCELPFLRVPLLLSVFQSLRRLTLSHNSYYRFHHKLELSRIIQSLSCRLETLELSFYGADEVFLPLELHEPNIADLFESTNSTGFTSESDTTTTPLDPKSPHIDSARIIDMRKAFPNLRSLSIINCGSTTSWTSADFAHLPSNLLSFTYITSPYFHWRDVSKLPQSIEFLALTDFSLLEPCFSHLPRSLTRLHGYARLLSLLKYEKSLPPGLDTTLIDVYDISSNQFSTSYQWPRALSHVSFPDESELRTVLKLGLPSHLTEISFPSQTATLLTGADISLLPPGITTVTIGKADWSTITSDHWPKSVTMFTQFCDDTSPTNFIRLPRTLKHVELNIEGPYQQGVPELPIDESCKPYMEVGKEAIASVDAKLFAQLVEEQKTLPKSMLNIKNLDAIAEGCLFGLPLTITKLQCYTTNYPTLLLTLPPFTTDAWVFGHLSDNWTQNFTLSLPPTLRTLSMNYGEPRPGNAIWTPRFGLSEASVPSYWRGLSSLTLANVPLGPAQLSLFPRQLSVLSISDATPGYLSEVDLKQLPPALVRLKLPWALNSSLNADGPESQHDEPPSSFEGPTLKKVSTTSSTCFSLLPRSLLQLEAPCWDIYASDLLANAPPLLQELRVRSLRATEFDIFNIPRTLSTLHVTATTPCIAEIAQQKPRRLWELPLAYTERSAWGGRLDAARHQHRTMLMNDTALQREFMPSGAKRR